MAARQTLLTLLISLTLCAGCASRNCCPTSGGACRPQQMFPCRAVEREAVRPDVALVSAQSSAELDGKPKLCALPEATAQCLAAKNSTVANLLAREADASAAQPGGLCSHSRSPLTSDLLRLEATAKRNSSAATALQTLLRLLEAEAGADNLARRGVEVDLMLTDMRRLQERGVLPPTPKSEIEGQRLELWHKQAELRATIGKLNYQLQDLLGVQLEDNTQFWPEVSLAVAPTVPDRNEAVQLALANRPDLAALRLVSGADSADSAAATRTLLQLSGSGLGAAPPAPCCCLMMLLRAHGSGCEDAYRAQQLADLLAERRRTVRNETLQSIVILETRLAQIGVTRRRLEVAAAHLKATQQQYQAGAGLPLTVRKARLELIGVEQDLLHDAIEWKLATVAIRESQGLLAAECGFDSVARLAGQGTCRR